MPRPATAQHDAATDVGGGGSRKANKKALNAAKRKTEKTFKQTQASVGLLVTGELQAAIKRCGRKVQHIAKHCRARNSKFRDPEFDLENDKRLCLYGLNIPDEESEQFSPAGVMRVTEIWDNPVFSNDGFSSSDLSQGAIGDCYFISALANVATIPGLLEKICVAQEPVVGVYGFIFFRDGTWVDVIIDDQLFVSLPKYESLTKESRSQGTVDDYNSYRKGNKIIYFGKSKTEGETWVPLIEKAYAKLHGNYHYIVGGFANEAIEDLTGAVCSRTPINDILDPNQFWNELITTAGRTKLFGCSVRGDNPSASDVHDSEYGLVAGHAYTVLKAVEYKGKRFVLVRNPWGSGEWKGRFSDGSNEWTAEWKPVLKMLNHSFGEDGAFVMEFSDFLRHWTKVDCARLFDSTWASSDLWLQMNGLGPLHPWTWGDISFTISVPENTPAVIVLRQLDTRYYQDISGSLDYTFEFVVFRKGSNEEYAVSPRGQAYDRSQSVEVDLKAGEYVVHVRLDSLPSREEVRGAIEVLHNELIFHQDYFEKQMSNWNPQVLKRVLAQRAIAYNKASNSTSEWNDTIPTSLRSLAGLDLTSLEIKKVEKKRQEQAKRMEELAAQGEEEAGDGEEAYEEEEAEEENEEAEEENEEAEGETEEVQHQGITCDNCGVCPIVGIRYSCNNEEHPNYDLCQECYDTCDHNAEHEMTIIPVPRDQKPMHKGIVCSDCGMDPISGTRYNCLSEDCEDVNLCEDCYAKKEHNQTHSMWMMPLPQSSDDDEGVGFDTDRPVHQGVACNGCGMSPVVGPRFKCMDSKCPEYDLCEDCFALGIHPSDHRMLRLDDPNEALHLNPAAAAEGSTLVLGLRVYTRKAAAVLGGQLKHGSLK